MNEFLKNIFKNKYKSKFIPSYRFTLEYEKNEKLGWYVQKVNINYVKKELTLYVYNHLDLDQVIEEILNKKCLFILGLYDEYGNLLKKYKLHNAVAVDHNIDYDYASSEISSHKLIFCYTKREEI